MQDCQVCGREFDPLAFQVVVPELRRGFDRIECAQSARALASPGNKIAAAPPLVAVVEPIGAGAPAAWRAAALRPIGATAATVGLLAAGTAAASVLWIRVLGTDTAAFPLDRAAAPQAVAQETVRAEVSRAPEGAGRSVARAPSEHPVPESATTVLSASGERSHRSTHPIKARPTHSPTHSVAARPTVRTTSSPSAKTTGKDHVKRGKGHYKHGETDGIHKPGHGLHGHHGHHGRGH